MLRLAFTALFAVLAALPIRAQTGNPTSSQNQGFRPVGPNTQPPTSGFVGTTIAGYDFALVQNGDLFQLIVTAAIPGPSTYATLAGALALGLALYRRRRPGSPSITGSINSMTADKSMFRLRPLSFFADHGTVHRLALGLLLVTSAVGLQAQIVINGTVTVPTDHASPWNLTDSTGSNPLSVGYGADGTLNIISGGDVTYRYVGVNGGFIALTMLGSSATGTINVDGTGSTLDLRSSLIVGQTSNGFINVTNGGAVYVESEVRISNGGPGQVTVSGANSTFTSGNDITVKSNGSLIVKDGGTVAMSPDLATRSIILSGAGFGAPRLQIGDGGAAGTVDADLITTNGPETGGLPVVVFNHTGAVGGGAYTFAPLLGGRLSVQHVGPGTTVFTGTHVYSGGTTITGGLINFDSGQNFGSGSIVLNGGGLQWASGNSTDITLLGTFNRSFGAAGATFDTNGNNVTFAQAYTGNGMVTKSGAGTLTLTSDGSSAVSTIISGGTLQIGSGGLSGTYTGNITNNARLVFNRNDVERLTYAQVISGTGTVEKLGTGTLVLTGNNTYTGATTITGGTLQLGNGDYYGSLVGDVVNNSAFVVNRAGDVTLPGAISGTGSLTKNGTGALILTGANTHSGGTSVNAGTLQIGDGGTSGSLSGNLTLASATGVIFNRSDASSYAGIASGTGSLTKSGSGTLTLSGANTYSGGTTLNAGTLGLGSPSALGSGILTINGGTLRAVGSPRTVTNAVVLNGDFTLGRLTHLSGNLTLGADLTLTSANPDSGSAENSTLGGVISGAHSLTFADGTNPTGTLTLSGANTYSGTTTLNSGALILGNSLALQNSTFTQTGGTLSFGSLTAATFGGLAGSQNLALVNNSSVAVALTLGGNNAPTTYSGILSGTGSLTKSGSGTLTLSGANTYSGGTTLNAGTLGLGSASVLGSGILTINGGTLRAVGSPRTVTNAVVLNGDFTLGRLTHLSGNLTLGADLTLTSANPDSGSAENSTLGGVISGAHSLTFADGTNPTGTLTLSGANTYSGTTTLNSGALILGNSLALQNSTFTQTGGTLSFGSLTAATFGGLAGSQNLALLNNSSAAVALTLGGNNAPTTYSGILSGTGSLTVTGSGTHTLTGANTYSGGTTLNAGTLAVGTATALGSGTLTIDGGILANSADLTLTKAISLGNSGGTINTTGGFLTLTNVISGSGAITKSGSNILTLSGDQTYTGSTTVNAGTLKVGGALASSAISLGAGTTLIFANSQTYSGNISGSGRLAHEFSGTTTLTGTASQTGGTSIVGGALQIGNGGTSGSLAGNVTLSGGGTLEFNRSDAVTFAGGVSGTGNLTKTGTGTLNLSGASTFTGITTVSAGTLAIGTANRLPDGSALTVASGATFSLGNFSETVGSLAGAGSVSLGSGTLTVGGDNTSTTFTGIVAGTGGLTKAGSGTFTLSGNNSYSGGTTVSAGTLTVTHVNALGVNRPLTVASGATLNTTTLANFNVSSLSGAGTINAGAGPFAVNQNTDTTWSGSLTGNGSLTKSGTGTLVLSGNNTYTGGTTLAAGTLQIGNGGTSGSLAGDVVNQGSLIFNRTDASALAGSISGTGSLTKNGAGTLTLSGANTYSGPTGVNAGTLALTGGNNRLPSASTVYVASGATLDLGGYSHAVAGLGSVVNPILGNLTNGTLVQTGEIFLSASTNATFTGSSPTARLWIDSYEAPTTLTLNGTNNSVYTADHNQVIMGYNSAELLTVKLGNANALAAATENVEIWNGTLDLNGQTDVRANSLILKPTIPTIKLTNSNTSTAASFGGSIILQSEEGYDDRARIGGAGVLHLSGTLSGTGNLNKTGTGTLILSGTNSYTGNTTVSTGTLQIGNGGTSGSIIGDVSVSSGRTLAFNRSDATTFAGVISGAGKLTKLGAGTLTLTGTNTYTGATAINAGTLLVNGSLANSAVSVASGGTLGGSGSIAGLTTVASGGHLAPGNSPGTLTFTNGLTLVAGSILDFQLGSTSDLLRISGGTLSGPLTGLVTLNLTDSGGFTAGTYTLFDFTSAATSSFDIGDFTFGTTHPGYTYALAFSGSTLALTATASAIPEPSTYAALLGALALGFAILRRRKK